jgi:hypothetical protein
VKGLEGRIEELKKEMTETDTKHTAALERKASELTEARGVSEGCVSQAVWHCMFSHGCVCCSTTQLGLVDCQG